MSAEFLIICFSLVAASIGTGILELELRNGIRVLEDSGVLKACVILRNASEQDRLMVTLATSTIDAIPNEDYVDELRRLEVFFYYTRDCINITILHNHKQVGNVPRRFKVIARYTGVTGTIAGILRSSLVYIMDVDSGAIELELNDSTRILETIGELDVCVSMRNFNTDQTLTEGAYYDLYTSAISATPDEDYTSIRFDNELLTAGDSRRCYSIPIIHSAESGNQPKSFEVILYVRTTTPKFIQYSQISFTRVVYILDIDVPLLALANMTSVEVMERNLNEVNEVWICLRVLSVGIYLDRADIVYASTFDGTAIANNDYMALRTTFNIPYGITAAEFISPDYCVQIAIFGDSLRERDETFFVYFQASLSRFQGPNYVMITILNGDDVNDCDLLSSPPNGMVMLSEARLGNMAQYLCNDNFKIVPESSRIRTCTKDGWNEVNPTCVASEAQHYNIQDRTIVVAILYYLAILLFTASETTNSL